MMDFSWTLRRRELRSLEAEFEPLLAVELAQTSQALDWVKQHFKTTWGVL